MRTLYEIIEAVKDDAPATEEELRYALIAYQSLHHFDTMALRRLAEHPERCIGPLGIKFERTEAFNRHKAALNIDPKTYVGWNNDPKNPQYQKERQVAVKIFEAAVKMVESNSGDR